LNKAIGFLGQVGELILTTLGKDPCRIEQVQQLGETYRVKI
jgi:hypothetical protein